MFISFNHVSDNKRKVKTLRDGFTLIEIMIVIMIGALVMAMGFGGFRWYRSVQLSQTERKLFELVINLQMYRDKVGEYPSDLNELIEGPAKPALRRKWVGGEVKQDDLKDSWGREFVYEKTPAKYRLYSTGPAGDQMIYAEGSDE